ncbi:MAG: hypothetical protein RR908_04065 [Rikenellaceae bacterium]
MENTYNSDFDDDDNELFLNNVIGDDIGLLNISRFLDRAYAEEDDV